MRQWTNACALAAALACIAANGMAQDTAAVTAAPAPARVSVQGVVRAERTGAPIPWAAVRTSAGVRTQTDSLGNFVLTGLEAGKLRLETIALGFRPHEVTVRVPHQGTLRLDVELTARMQQLPRLDVHARELGTIEEEHARQLFDELVVPSTTTLSGREMRELPTIGEPDVLRSLQMLPGVMAIIDLDAQLYVRGGAADQNLFLFDGAPVYGPYHAFGMNGVFNGDAVDNVEFFRGARPARYGGALSSVVAIRQRSTMDYATEAGFSVIGGSLTHAASFAGDRVRWLIGGRRTMADAVVGGRMPLAFYDAQTRVTIAPNSGHELSISAFSSADRFGMFFGDGDGEMYSRWRNAVGSFQWRSPRWRGWRVASNAWGSRYVASIAAGRGDSVTRTTDTLTVRGGRLEIDWQIPALQIVAGAEVEAADVIIEGSELAGSYFSGVSRNDYERAALYGEVEARVGPLRVAPGIRVVHSLQGADPLVEPRLGVRAQLGENASITFGASRDHQVISALRDERTVLPGAPFWFMHPKDAPASRADALTGELSLWPGPWHLTLSGYERRFFDLPRWRPVGTRDLAGLSYDAGSARGLEVGVRRYGRRASGWLGYAFNHTELKEAATGNPYHPVFDRRHTVNAALVTRPFGRTVLSTQGAFGTGLAFWPFTGNVLAPQFEPFVPGGAEVVLGREVPQWGDRQVRQPVYARVDVGIRRAFFPDWGSIEPYLNVQNVAGRPNVLYYDAEAFYDPFTIEPVVQLTPVTLPFTVLPTIGVNVRF